MIIGDDLRPSEKILMDPRGLCSAELSLRTVVTPLAETLVVLSKGSTSINRNVGISEANCGRGLIML